MKAKFYSVNVYFPETDEQGEISTSEFTLLRNAKSALRRVGIDVGDATALDGKVRELIDTRSGQYVGEIIKIN